MGGNVSLIDKDDIWEQLDNSRAYMTVTNAKNVEL